MKRKIRSNTEKMMNKKRETTAIKAYLPDELLEVILLKTTCKSLVRFRCVSKSWNTLLNQDFINTHLGYSKPNPTNLKLVIPVGSLATRDIEELKFNDCGFSGNIRAADNEIYGSCKGLILLCSDRPEKIRLMNPTTGECKLLPEAPSEPIENDGDIRYGLGYTEASKEYRVVRIRTVWKDKYPIPAELSVYSLSTNTWRIVPPIGDKSMPYTDLFMSGYHLGYTGYAGVFLNGALHWIATNKAKEEYIVAFDIEDEKFRKVLCPCCERFEFVRVSALEGKLCLVVRHQVDSENAYGVVLVMENYGFRHSWTELLRVKRDAKFDLYGVLPLCLTKDAEGVLLYNGDLTFYDLINMNTTKVYDLLHFYKKVRGYPYGYLPPTIYN